MCFIRIHLKRLLVSEDPSLRGWLDKRTPVGQIKEGLLTNLWRAATSRQLSAQHLANCFTCAQLCFALVSKGEGRAGCQEQAGEGRGDWKLWGQPPRPNGGLLRYWLSRNAHPEPLSNFFQVLHPGYITLLYLLLLPSFVFSTNKPES